MLQPKREQMRKDITNDNVVSSFLDKIIMHPSMQDIDGTLTPEVTRDSVVILLDKKRIAEIPYIDIEEYEQDMVEEACARIQQEKNMDPFIWDCLEIIADMIDSNYGSRVSMERDRQTLWFSLDKDGGEVHKIQLVPTQFNVKVLFDEKDTGIQIPDMTGDYFDYNLCYLNHPEVSYDENCIDTLALNYLS